MPHLTAVDLSVLDWIQAHLRTPVLDGFFSAVTHLSDAGLLWIVLAAVLLAVKKTRPLGLCLSLALLVDLCACNLILKPLFDRVRPYELNRFVELLISRPHDSSFPSGHTAASFAAISCLWRLRSKLWGPALAVGLVIAFSRLYLYVHYPSDILGGMVVGVAAGLAGAALGKRLSRRLRRWRFWP